MKKITLVLLALLLTFATVLPAQASEAAGHVAALMAELPTVEEFAAMDPDMQLESYNKTQAAYDAWMALSEEEKAQIPGAEDTFEALFTYFNAQVMPIDQAEAPQEGITGTLQRFFDTYGWAVITALAAVVGVFARKRSGR